MKLASMKRAPGEGEVALASPSLDTYPYGMRLSLDHDTIQRLDLDAEDMEVGKVLYLEARVVVASSTMSDSVESGPRCSIDLQITDAALDEEDDTDDAADRLYTKS